jgi:DNA topoisomerase-3
LLSACFLAKVTDDLYSYLRQIDPVMILYIAEKPSLARAIAAVLPKPQQKQAGCIRLANGDVVSWCVGHLLEQAEPEDYEPRYKKWLAVDLPIVPQQWQLKPRQGCVTQLRLLKKLIKDADTLVHAGDPDREGQLLVDEVLHWAGTAKSKLASARRLLINDLNPAAVTKALQQLRANNEFSALSASALARSRADWLYGINLTRAYTLQGQQSGYRGVLSVGRVQTPVLGLVVRRDAEIANFVSTTHYQVQAQLQTAAGECFSALWQPSAACEPYQDSEGRVLSRQLAELVQRKVSQQPAKVEQLTRRQKTIAAPLPLNLSTLQIEAAKRYGLSAQQVLDICQQLYEQQQLITYPRSDNRYLPRSHHQDAPAVTAAILQQLPALALAVRQADLNLRSKAWDDTKVEAHHAIIPTANKVAPGRLSASAQKVYQLIAHYYLAQFYPAALQDEQKVSISINGGHFLASATTERQAGWKGLFRADPAKHITHEQAGEAEPAATGLPALTEGQLLHSADACLLEKQTQPPAAFTDATLLAAMTGISRYVKDPAVRQILKDTDGLGTEATRAGIIELLFKRGYLLRQGKTIVATDTGKALIAALPERLTLPDLTAQWEAALAEMSQRQLSYPQFMLPLQQQLQQLVQEAAVSGRLQLTAALPHSGKLTQKNYKKRAVNSARRRRARPAT